MKILILLSLLTTALFADPGDLNRRKITPNYYPSEEEKKIKVAFFDADSTLRISKSGNLSANSPDDFILLPGVAKKVRELNREGIFVAIVSNQAGIPKFVSLKDADSALFNLQEQLLEQNAVVNYYDFAENRDNNRKPGIGMAERLNSELKSRFENEGIDWANSYMVGDAAYTKNSNSEPGETRPDGTPGRDFTNSDRLFAENIAKLHPGFKFYEPNDFFGWSAAKINRIDNKDELSIVRKYFLSCKQLLGGLKHTP